MNDLSEKMMIRWQICACDLSRTTVTVSKQTRVQCVLGSEAFLTPELMYVRVGGREGWMSTLCGNLVHRHPHSVSGARRSTSPSPHF